jgi:colicin import membrane protein
METAWDKTRAVLFALLLHALVVGLLFVGLLWQPLPKAEAAEGPAIEASLVSSPRQSAELAKEIRALERRTAQDETHSPPKPEPRPQNAPRPPQPIPQARIPRPDTVDQDEVRRLAEQRDAQKRLQEQDERRKQAQLDLSRKQEQAQEEIRQRQLADIQKKLADAARQVKLHEQALKQLRDQQTQLALNNTPRITAPNAPPRPPAGNNGRANNLADQYLQAIRAVVNANWRHDNIPEGVHCIVTFRQMRGGEVFGSLVFGDCPFDAAARASVEDALHRTPLPYAGYEPVFQPTGTIDLCYPEEACAR